VVACTALNLIQTYQYTHYILPAAEMDWQGYKDIFLKTDEKYVGMLTYRAYGAQIRGHAVKSTHVPLGNVVIFKPGEWNEIAAQEITLDKQNRLNAIITLDCSKPEGEKLYMAIDDSLRNSIYFEEIPLVRICADKTGMQAIDFSIEFNTVKTGNAMVRVGFYQLKKVRKVQKLIVQELDGSGKSN
jgi:hypothetical protein